MCNRYTPSRLDDPVFARLGRLQVNFPPSNIGKIGPYGLAPFFRPADTRDAIRGELGQWGMIRPNSPERRPMKNGRPMLTNNARSETMATLPTFRDAWRNGQRCIIPALGFDEPNWETGKNVWWEMRRADGHPWGIAGLYSFWTDPETGEIIPSFTMPTINADGHTLFKRLHKHDPALPDHAQDKRAVVPLHPEDWEAWLYGSNDEAKALLYTQPLEVFDAGPAR